MATVRVSWKGVSSIGYTMRGNLSLEYNGTALTKGFTSTREVTVEQDGLERKFTVECKILGDGMGNPIFECDVMEHGEAGLFISHTVKRSKSPQTAMRTALEAVGVVENTKKKRNGYKFFGLQMPAVLEEMKLATPPPDDMPSPERSGLQAVVNSPEFNKGKVKWVSRTLSFLTLFDELKEVCVNLT